MSKTLKKTTVLKTVKQVASNRARLECRINLATKQRAERAASLLGQDLTTFTEAALNEKAQAVIEREERIQLSEKDFASFVEAIENPKPVGSRLKAAAEEYKAVRQAHPELNW